MRNYDAARIINSSTFQRFKKKNSMCTLHIENPSNSVSVQAVHKTHKIISF